MAILETRGNLAYGEGSDDRERKNFWTGCFAIEKGIYEKILSNPTEVIGGTVEELAEKYEIEVLIMTGLLDGVSESLRGCENPIDTMEGDTVVKIEIGPEKLHYNMVEVRADWLYSLPMWEDILPVEKRKELYKEQKRSGIIVKGPRVRRNDPCPCDSRLKYKKYCDKNQ